MCRMHTCINTRMHRCKGLSEKWLQNALLSAVTPVKTQRSAGPPKPTLYSVSLSNHSPFVPNRETTVLAQVTVIDLHFFRASLPQTGVSV